jgi:DNA-binding helix-hairpin-helix protein with protein kinase domain/thioredoxin-like negative regulator of GroEL
LAEKTNSQLFPMSALFYTTSDKPLRLGPKLGTGGEGTVYEVEGAPALVAKLYHEPISEERAAKLEWLARAGTERLFKLTAWPVDVVREQPGGRVVGFTMRRIGQAEEVHALHSPKSRLQKFPEASWAFLLYVAANIARAVAAVHEHEFIVGDLNPKNILVTRQATVYLLDCDSFQVRAGEKVYRCEGGFPDYTPPELQGVAFRDVDRTAAHDAFGLAVVIFQLLFLGRHPFSGKFTGGEEMPLERAIREGRFAYGCDAAERGMQPPPGTLALEAVSEPVMALLRRAFLQAPDERPQPREWVAALETLAQTLKRCAMHDGHQFYEGLAVCPWCEIEARARVRLFNFAPNGKQEAQGYFRLAEVWREVESVQPPRVPVIPNRMLLREVVPSAEVAALEQERRARFRRSLLAAIPSGLVIALLTNLPGSAWLFILLMAGVKQYVVNLGQPSEGLLNAIFQPSSAASYNPLLAPFEQRKQQAEETYVELDERWQAEASDNRFRDKLRELETWKLAYENLPSTRAQRLAQLEAAARADQLSIFLRQQSLRAAGLKEVGTRLLALLEANGIYSADDVTTVRLNQVMGLGEAGKQTLLDWRNRLERQFVFDAQRAVPSRLRLQVEQELDAVRVRLERDLSSGAEHLWRFQQEIKNSQTALYEPLLAAQRTFTQAELDWDLAKKQQPLWPVLMLLILSFLAGSWLEESLSGPVTVNKGAFPVQSAPGNHGSAPDKSVVTADGQAQARLIYNEAVTAQQAGRSQEAIRLYERALALDSKSSGAWHGLGSAYLSIGQHKEAVQAAERALNIFPSFEAYYVLGQAQLALKDYAAAKEAFQAASRVNWGGPQKNYWQAHFNLVEVIVRLREAKWEIATLQELLTANPDLIEERFQLAALYFLTGNQRTGRTELAKLRSKDAQAAAALTRSLVERDKP